MKDYEKKKLEKIHERCADINLLLQSNKDVRIDGLNVGTDISLFALDFLEEHIKAKAGEAKNHSKIKVEYEKVTESILDLKGDFERGNLYERQYSTHEDFCYEKITSEEHLSESLISDSIFRKVERSVEWWEDACDYASKIGNSQPIEATFSLDNSREYLLHVNAIMRKEQWCEFARIILDEGGE